MQRKTPSGGVVFYTPPIRLPDPRQPVSEPSEAKTVDVSMPDQIAAACSEIAKAGGLSTSASGDAATDALLGSMVGNYSCGSWFKAAAKNDPTLLIGLGFVPTTQLIRDLKTYTNGVVDVTPEAFELDQACRFHIGHKPNWRRDSPCRSVAHRPGSRHTR